ncbi:MAG: RHS repeat-associated core domain-containing protein [Candidatus Peregrinibacteria bacterium]
MQLTFKRVASRLIIFILSIVFVFGNTDPACAVGNVIRGEPKIYFFLTDQLGNITTALDADGNIVEQRDYLPFGDDRVNEPTESAKTDYGFTGKEKDDETGLYYYGARYYDPLIGRFISQDPLLLGEGDQSLESVVANPQALNPYSYTFNNPVKYVDPTGRIPRDASFLDKLKSILNFDSSGNGWLAHSAKAYAANPNPQTLAEMKRRQSVALCRLDSNPSPFSDETWDPITTKRILQLDSKVQIPATDFVNKTEEEQKTQLRVTAGYRTSKEQNEEYAKGRTKPGPIRTYAKGGESYHNYGLAMDVVRMKDYQPVWKVLGKPIVDIANSLGFEWGGHWPSPKTDNPHFQMTSGQSISDLKGKKK